MWWLAACGWLISTREFADVGSTPIFIILSARDSSDIVPICLPENSQGLLWITFTKKHHPPNQTHLPLPQQLLPTTIMARDAEPVGPRTARLLRSTANRRVSLLPIDAPAGAEEATTPWDIKNTEQLCQWAANQPDQIIDMLNFEVSEIWLYSSTSTGSSYKTITKRERNN